MSTAENHRSALEMHAAPGARTGVVVPGRLLISIATAYSTGLSDSGLCAGREEDEWERRLERMTWKKAR